MVLALGVHLAAAQPPARAEDAPAPVPPASPAAASQPASTIPPEIERRLRELEAEVKELKRELGERNATALKKTGPEEPKSDGDAKGEANTGGDGEEETKPQAGFQNGFFIQSPDGNFKLGLHALIQTQFRTYTSEVGRTGLTNFFLRRARPIIDGTVYKGFDFRVVPNFGLGRVQLFDAFVNYHHFREASLQFGKFKSPFSLERLQSAANLVFIERSIGNNLSPNRDIGIMGYGEGLKGRVTYQLAGLDGAPDNSGATVDSDVDRQGRGGACLPPALRGTEGLGAARTRLRLRHDLRRGAHDADATLLNSRKCELLQLGVRGSGRRDAASRVAAGLLLPRSVWDDGRVDPLQPGFAAEDRHP
jgi:hypothetical protein